MLVTSGEKGVLVAARESKKITLTNRRIVICIHTQTSNSRHVRQKQDFRQYHCREDVMKRMDRVYVVICLVTAVLVPPACGEPSQTERGTVKMTLKIESTAFDDGGMIPSKYTCEGTDISPSLTWGEPPEGTKSLALIADDPDAPAGTWVHWVVYNIPPDRRGLAENFPKSGSPGDGILQGTNDFGRTGYGGPCPPSGTHRYYFRLYALDTVPGLGAGATKRQLLEAMKGHVLAEGQLMGKYRRR